jgi:plasmid stability protein
MASLSIRKLDPKLYERLRIRAARHGVSMEEEVRKIIAKVVSAPDSITEIFIQNFGSRNGIDLELVAHKPHSPMEFDE